jgi:DNA ligase-1
MSAPENDYEIIKYEDIPSSKNWKMEKLFKDQANGRVRIFEIIFTESDQTIKTIYGLIDGKLQESLTEIIPKAGRSLQEQALQEAKKKFKEKIENDGFKPSGYQGVEIELPMKATKYEDGKFPLKLFPVCIQPKLDGIRIIASMRDGNVVLKTNGSNEIVHFLEIKSQIKKLLDLLPFGTKLDGEFYNRDIEFETLNSIVRTTLEKHPDEHLIFYNIFDLNYGKYPFEVRYKKLSSCFKTLSATDSLSNIKIVKTKWDVENHSVIMEYHDKYKKNGYEGLMIRFQVNDFAEGSKEYERTLYKDGRNTHLYKYKEFLDNEALIIDITDGMGKFKGQGILKTKYIDEDKNVIILSMTSPGNEEQKRHFFENKKLYIGKYVTFKYQEVTKTGIPRFPIALRLRDETTMDV